MPDFRNMVVMRFDLEHVPQFEQGYREHEVLEPVTAEHCKWFVAEIERLKAYIAQRKWEQENIGQQAAGLEAQSGEAIIKFVPVSDAADRYGNHPNDKEPRDEKLSEVFRQMGDDIGQGVSPYWKWGFASGWNAAKLYLRAQQAVPEGWKLLGETRENGVVWFDQNPHAFPIGTQFYAAAPSPKGENHG